MINENQITDKNIFNSFNYIPKYFNQNGRAKFNHYLSKLELPNKI